jgi:hypothetical protein
MCEMAGVARVNRDSDRDSKLVILELRAQRLRREREDKNVAGLRRIKRQLENFEPWQRGLLQLLHRLPNDAAKDAVASRNRAAGQQWREAQRRRVLRGADRAAVAPGKPGRPWTAYDRLLFAAAVSTRKLAARAPTFCEIAKFLLDVSWRIPADLRAPLIGPPELTAPTRLRRLSARLRQRASTSP